MLYIILTTEFGIDKRVKENKELIGYLDSITSDYCSIYRFVWSLWVNKEKLNKYTANKPNTLKSKLCHQFSIKARVANSIIQSVKGRYSALKELKKHELTELDTRIESLSRRITTLKETINKEKLVIVNLTTCDMQLIQYRKLKNALYQRQGKLNRLQQKREQLNKEIRTGKLSICFGSKDFFKKQHSLAENGYTTHLRWLREFRRKRNNQLSYIGENTNGGNQLVKLEIHPLDYSILQVTHHLTGNKAKYVGLVKVNHLSKELTEQLDKNQTTSYRFIRRKDRWAVQAFVNMELKKEHRASCSDEGVIGLDFNVGYITLSEIDKKGNLVKQREFYYDSYGTQNQNRNSLRQEVAKIVDYAVKAHKDIIIEDLDFKKKKARLSKGKGNKNYNKMLSCLAYSHYMEAVQCKATKNNIYVKVVNPAYTSKIATQKYCKTKKLNTHQGASYVIARRGLGFSDRYKKIS